MSSNFLSTYEILFNRGLAEIIAPPPQKAKGTDHALEKAIIAYCREKLIAKKGDASVRCESRLCDCLTVKAD